MEKKVSLFTRRHLTHPSYRLPRISDVLINVIKISRTLQYIPSTLNIFSDKWMKFESIFAKLTISSFTYKGSYKIFLYVKEFNNMNLKLEVCNKRGISNYLFNTFFISIFNTIKTFGVMQIQFHFNFHKRTSTPHLEI